MNSKIFYLEKYVIFRILRIPFAEKAFGIDKVCFFRGGGSGGIVVLLSSLTSFVASTRLIRSAVGAIDSPDQSRRVFDQYDPLEVPEKNS